MTSSTGLFGLPDFFAPGVATAFVLTALRVGGLLLVAPAWSAKSFPMKLRTAVLVVFATLLIPSASATSDLTALRITPVTFLSETIIGSKGTLYFSDGGTQIKDRAGKTLWRYRKTDEDGDPYQNEHDELYKAIREDKKLNNAQYGATSTFTAMLGRYATYSGKMVKWDEALAWDNSELPEKLDFKTPTRFSPDADGLYPVAVPGKFDPSKPLGYA